MAVVLAAVVWAAAGRREGETVMETRGGREEMEHLTLLKLKKEWATPLSVRRARSLFSLSLSLSKSDDNVRQ